MFDEPNQDRPEREQPDRPFDPAIKAREKSDYYRMHAELAAVFEGGRKFEAQLLSDLLIDQAREIQRIIGRLEKSRVPESPIVADPAFAKEAANLLDYPTSKGLSTNDYHVSRRPGEVMIVRWMEGDQVETYYERLQAHFDAGFNYFKEDERQSNEWKQDARLIAYLDALDKIEVKMDEKYLREPIRQHKLFVLSTQAADELDIQYLCDHVMGISPANVVGSASAPPDEPTEKDRAWFFKLFSLRGVKNAVERMCFFAYLQKTDDGTW